MRVVKQMDVVAVAQAQRLEQFRGLKEILLRTPDILWAKAPYRRFIKHLVLGNAVSARQTRHTGLGSHSQITHLDKLADFVRGLRDVAAVSMAIHHDSSAALSAQEIVKRRVERLTFDVPECHIHGGNGAHGDRSFSPVGAAVEILPDIFGLKRVASNETRNQMVRQVTGDRKFAPVQSAISEPVDSFVGVDFESDEIPSGGTDKDFGVFDFHSVPPAHRVTLQSAANN